jgi:uncharacterized protein
MIKTKKKVEVEKLKRIIVPILKKHGIRRAGIFGSYARGEQKKDSDVDILVEIDSSLSLIDFIGIKLSLEDSLHRKVDLVEYPAIKLRIRKQIMDEEVRLL